MRYTTPKRPLIARHSPWHLVAGVTAAIVLANFTLSIRSAQAQTEEPVKTITEAENVPNRAEQAPADVPALPLPPDTSAAQPVAPANRGGLFERSPRPTQRTQATSTRPLGLVLANLADRQVRVRDIQPNSAAAQAGVRAGDVLVSLAGQPVESDEQFVRSLADLRNRRANSTTDAIPLIVQRDGSLLTLQFSGDAIARSNTAPSNIARSDTPARDALRNLPRVGRRIPQTLTRGQERRANASGNTSGYLGIELDPRFPQAAIVASVMPGSAAAQAGLQPGDRIFALNLEPINTSAELVAWIAELNPGDQLEIKFDRPQNARVTLGTRPPAASGPMPTSPPDESSATPEPEPAAGEPRGLPEAAPAEVPSPEFKDLPRP